MGFVLMAFVDHTEVVFYVANVTRGTKTLGLFVKVKLKLVRTFPNILSLECERTVAAKAFGQYFIVLWAGISC